jgi:hypothetical protein
MVVLSERYGNGISEALGLGPMPDDTFMAVSREEVEGLSDAARRGLSDAARRRYGLE